MGAPGRKRPLRRKVTPPGPNMDVAAITERVSYVGSLDHEDTPPFGGQRSPRKDASICDGELSQDLQLVT
jgi:hypothetical protein